AKVQVVVDLVARLQLCLVHHDAVQLEPVLLFDTPVACLLPQRLTNGDMFLFPQKTIGRPDAIPLTAPTAVGIGLIEIDNDRPVPLHILDAEGGPQLILVRADRAVLYPEGWPAGIAEATPGPSGLAPVFSIEVSAAG